MREINNGEIEQKYCKRIQFGACQVNTAPSSARLHSYVTNEQN